MKGNVNKHTKKEVTIESVCGPAFSYIAEELKKDSKNGRTRSSKYYFKMCTDGPRHWNMGSGTCLLYRYGSNSAKFREKEILLGLKKIGEKNGLTGVIENGPFYQGCRSSGEYLYFTWEK